MADKHDGFWKALEPEYRRAAMFCRKLTGDRDKGDDLFQDSLVIACTKFGDLRNREAFRTWLYRIMVSTFRSTVRRPWWKKVGPLTGETEELLTTPDPTDRHTARRWLDRSFQALSADDQALVVLYELDGWSLGDLAGLRKCSEGAIKLRLHRARRKMRQVIEKHERRAERLRALRSRESETTKCVAAKPGID